MASLTVQTIFGVLQRLHHAGTYAGSGIGLAIVQKSVERMGGKVGVLPLPENGSSNVPFVLQTVQSGDSAIAYLEGAPPFSDRAKSPLPDAILLDLKMPGRSGFDVLKWIKSQPHFAGLPILVFTSSIHEEDRARALAMDASRYVVKPVDFGTLQLLLQDLDQIVQAQRSKHPAPARDSCSPGSPLEVTR